MNLEEYKIEFLSDFDDMRMGAAGTDLPAVKETFREQFEQKYTSILR